MIQEDRKQTTHSAFGPKTALERLELAFKVTAILGSLVAIYQYFDTPDIKQENRIKQTMEQSKIFNGERLENARLNLVTTWDKYLKPIQYITQQTVENKQARAEILAKFVLPVIAQNKLQRDIDLLVNFFENLQVCVQHQICDKEVAVDFFCDYADSFYQLHQPWIEVQREVIPSYAKKLQEFVKSECAKISDER